MKKTVYIRVSTEAQSYDRQMYEMKSYFDRMGMSMDDIDIVQEKITSYTQFKDRAIYPILHDAQEGDIIYVCQLDRLGRTVEDIISLVKYADQRGVVIIGTKDNQQITYKTQTGKMMLTLLAMVAEMERELRAERCQAGIDAAKEEIARNGYRISRSSGKVQTRIGHEKGSEVAKRCMAAAREGAAQKKQEELVRWRETSIAYDWVRRQVDKGKPRATIIEEFNELHARQPDVYCTREGSPLSKGVLSKWIRQMGLV